METVSRLRILSQVRLILMLIEVFFRELGNVLKELVEPEGAVIFAKAFELGDDSVSTLELWGAEYQENNAVLCNASDVAIMKEIAHRERCPINVVGTVTGSGQVKTGTRAISELLDQLQ